MPWRARRDMIDAVALLVVRIQAATDLNAASACPLDDRTQLARRVALADRRGADGHLPERGIEDRECQDGVLSGSAVRHGRLDALALRPARSSVDPGRSRIAQMSVG